MFNFIKESLRSIYTTVTSKLTALFLQPTIDHETLAELKRLLINADVGIQATTKIMKQLQTQYETQRLTTGSQLKTELETLLINSLHHNDAINTADIIMLVGVNGTGKTTNAAKLAYKYKQEGKRVLLAAADTFRAAAVEQLTEWATKLKIDIISGTNNQDPASVVFTAARAFHEQQYDILIIDTAGRLQTKQNLMNELSKMHRVITKHNANARIATLLTIDAMLGQNSLHQARVFHESTSVDGVILTKMDGTGKGGIVCAISQELNVPVSFISYGEQPNQLQLFNAREYVSQLLSQ